MTRRSTPEQPRPEVLAFLRAVVDSPGDDTPLLVLADWLEEHDEPRRAELLRLHLGLRATCCQPDRHPERAEQQARLTELLRRGVRPVVPEQSTDLGEGVPLTFAWIPPGSFLMGSPPDEPQRRLDESQHRVRLTRGFWLAVCPVTQPQWLLVMDDNPSDHRGTRLPVERVSWQDCQVFCSTLRGRTGRRFRLPTEAEWEYACRAGTTTPFHFGDTVTGDLANCGSSQAGGRGRTTSLRRFPPNAWGLYGMHGNVYEWCHDWYADYPAGEQTDPAGPSPGDARVQRGGDWFVHPEHCRSAARTYLDPATPGWNASCRPVLCG
jgi:uncharacterized protein (TIGR02996 family)